MTGAGEFPHVALAHGAEFLAERSQGPGRIRPDVRAALFECCRDGGELGADEDEVLLQGAVQAFRDLPLHPQLLALQGLEGEVGPVSLIGVRALLLGRVAGRH